MNGTDTDTFDRSEMLAELTIDEAKRHQPYLDTFGNITIGIGRNLSGNGISDSEIVFLFDNDIQACVDLLDQHIGWWRQLAPNEQRVMINLCFNLGWAKFSAFGNFMAAMKRAATLREAGQEHDPALRTALTEACDQLRASRWWNQVGIRGPRTVARLMAAAPPESAPMV
jgi:lysozyme